MAAIFGDDIHVSVEDDGMFPMDLSFRADIRPNERTVVATVLFDEDGTRGVGLRRPPRRQPSAMDAAFECAKALASDYAVACVADVDGVTASASIMHPHTPGLHT